MTEVELKFVLDAEALAALRDRLRAETGTEPRARRLTSLYYDTEDRRLRGAGIALRLRKDGRRWVQTVKARAQLSGGLSRVEEIEVPAPGGRLDLGRFPSEPAADALTAALGDGTLVPACETAMARIAAEIVEPAGVVDVALDSGEIRAGDAAMPFHEAEFELVSGDVAALYTLAERLLPCGGLRFSTLNKAARGHLLAETGQAAPPLEPRKALSVTLTPDQTAETAARDVLREALAQVCTNVAVVLDSDAPEGPHQLRIGLRRLRSALDTFRPVIGGAAAAALSAEARWLGQDVGRLRDLDVLLTDLIAPEAQAAPEETGFAALADAVAERRAATRASVHSAMRSPRCHRFLFSAGRFVEARGWLRPGDYAQTAELAQPLAAVAGAALDRRWAKAAKRGKKISQLDIEARHELRKELKKLRYTVEFLGSLYDPKRVGAFVKLMKRLQEMFGNLNDLATAETLLTGPDAPAADDPDAQRAVGRLLGGRAVRAEYDWIQAKSLWRDLTDAGPFWTAPPA